MPPQSRGLGGADGGSLPAVSTRIGNTGRDTMTLCLTSSPPRRSVSTAPRCRRRIRTTSGAPTGHRGVHGEKGASSARRRDGGRPGWPTRWCVTGILVRHDAGRVGQHLPHREVEGLGQCLDHGDRGLMQPPLDLAEVRDSRSEVSASSWRRLSWASLRWLRRYAPNAPQVDSTMSPIGALYRPRWPVRTATVMEQLDRVVRHVHRETARSCTKDAAARLGDVVVDRCGSGPPSEPVDRWDASTSSA